MTVPPPQRPAGLGVTAMPKVGIRGFELPPKLPLMPVTA
jgi:hypothetical protein